jgi:hypothetical protein
MTQLTTADLHFVGQDLVRPECVIPTARGDLFASDRRGGIMRLGADGTQQLIQGHGLDGFFPNGFSLLPDRSFAIANLGPDGGAWRMAPDGALSPEVLEVDGAPLPPTNFVNADHSAGELRLWVSVSTRQVPREQAFQKDVADGYIVLKDRRGTRIAADGIGFANENKLSPDGCFLYVNETMGRRISRFPVGDDARLGRRETVAEFGPGTFPDGFEFDAEGGIWIASVVSNRLLRIAPDGTQTVVIEDSEPAVVAAVERKYAAGEPLLRPDIDAGRDRVLGNLASVAFGGPDLCTVFLGSLFAPRIATFRSAVAGAAPPHWHY